MPRTVVFPVHNAARALERLRRGEVMFSDDGDFGFIRVGGTRTLAELRPGRKWWEEHRHLDRRQLYDAKRRHLRWLHDQIEAAGVRARLFLPGHGVRFYLVDRGNTEALQYEVGLPVASGQRCPAIRLRREQARSRIDWRRYPDTARFDAMAEQLADQVWGRGEPEGPRETVELFAPVPVSADWPDHHGPGVTGRVIDRWLPGLALLKHGVFLDESHEIRLIDHDAATPGDRHDATEPIRLGRLWHLAQVEDRADGLARHIGSWSALMRDLDATDDGSRAPASSERWIPSERHRPANQGKE